MWKVLPEKKRKRKVFTVYLLNLKMQQQPQTDKITLKNQHLLETGGPL